MGGTAFLLFVDELVNTSNFLHYGYIKCVKLYLVQIIYVIDSMPIKVKQGVSKATKN